MRGRFTPKIFNIPAKAFALAWFGLRKTLKPAYIAFLVFFALLTLGYVIFSSTQTTKAAGITKYARAAGGNWSSASTWSTTSNGAADTTVPTAEDDVVFDNFSGNVTITVSAFARSLNMTGGTGYTGILTHNASVILYIGDASGGSLNFTGAWTYTLGSSTTSGIYFVSTSTNGAAGWPITWGGKTTGNVTFSGNAGKWVFQDDLNSPLATLNHTYGTLETNGKTVSLDNWQSEGTTTRVLNLGSSTVNLGNLTWTSSTSGMTFNAGTSTVNISGTNFHPSNSKTFNNVNINIATNNNINGSLSHINNLTVTGPATKTGTFTLVYDFYVDGTLTISGNSDINRLLVKSNTVGTSRTINSANNSISNADFMDITGAGAASWDLSAITGLSGDAGGNTGITFTPAAAQTWTNAAGGNWSDAANWTSRVPLPQDDVSFATAFNSGVTVTADMPRLGKSITWDGSSYTGTKPNFTLGIPVTNYGSLTLISGITFTSNQTWTFGGRINSYTITSAEKTFNQNVYIWAPTGTYTLTDAMSLGSSRYLFPDNGTFNTAGYDLSIGAMISSGSATRALNISNSVVTINYSSTSWNMGTNTGMTFAGTGSTIVMAYTGANATSFVGNTYTYNNIQIAPGSGVLTFSGAFTFANMTMSSAGAKTVKFTKSTTYTMTGSNFLSGTNGNIVTIDSDDGATAFTLSKTSGTITSDFVSLARSTAQGGATWNATHSTNVGGNTGWNFAKTPTAAGGNWSSTSTWYGGVVPTNTDDIIFDSVAGPVTIDAAAVAKSINFTGYTNTLTHNSAVDLTVSGNLTMVAGMNYTTSADTSRIIINATSNITTGGKLMGNFEVNGSGITATLQDAFSTRANTTTLTLTQGTLNTNNQAVSVGRFSSANTNTRTITLGSSNITITMPDYNGRAWDSNTATNLTLNSGTSTVTFTGASARSGFGGTMNNVVFQGGGTTIWYSGNCNNLTFTGTASKSDSINFSGGPTVSGTFTVSGNSATNRVLLYSTTLGSGRTITAANVSISNTDFQDIRAAGAANWDLSAIAGGSGDAGGNTGITFTPAAAQTWTNVNGGNWSDSGNWTSRVPLPQDDASFAIAFGASKTVIADMPRLGKNVTWTGASGTPTWSAPAHGDNRTLYGSLAMISEMNIGTNLVPCILFEGRGSFSLTSAGKTFYDVKARVVGGTLTILDAVSVLRSFYAESGTLTVDNVNVTISGTSNPNFRTYSGTTTNMGSGTWTITPSGAYTFWNIDSGSTLNASNATIAITGTSANAVVFSGSNKTYNNITISPNAGVLTFSGAFTFNNMTMSSVGAKTVKFTNSTTYTMTGSNFLSGTSGNLITIDSDDGATAFTMNKTSGVVVADYVAKSRMQVGGGATWYSTINSTPSPDPNTSGNTGWTASGSGGVKTVSPAGGNWDATTTWNEGSVPTTSDSIFGLKSSGNLTMNVSGSVKAFDFTPYTGTLALTNFLACQSVVGIDTTCSLGSAMAINGTASLAVRAQPGRTTTFYSNGLNLGVVSLTTNGSSGYTGTVRLGDNLAMASTSSVTHSYGTFDTQNYSMNIGKFASSNSNTRTINLGSSAITITGSMTYQWDTSTASGLTLNSGTSTITLTGSNPTLAASSAGGGYNNIVFQGSGTNTVYSGLTIANLSVIGSAAKTDTAVLNGNVTVTGTLTITGNSSINRILIKSDTLGTTRTLTSANNSFSNVDFQDIAAAGAADWDLSAITGGSGDCGGNTGITFTPAATQTWNGASGGNWSTNAWSGRVPLPQDDVRFNGTQFSSAQTVTADMPRLGKSIDWTGMTYTGTRPTMSYPAAQSTTMYGSLTLVADMTFTSGSTASQYYQGRAAGMPEGGWKITSATKNFASGYEHIQAYGATYKIEDNFRPNILYVDNGTFNANNYNVTGYYFVSKTSATRSILMGSGTWTFSVGTIAAWDVTSAGLTIDAGTSTIILSYTGSSSNGFSGSTFVYNNIQLAAGSGVTTFSGAFTFNNMTMSSPGAKTVKFTKGTTYTMTGDTFLSGTADVAPLISGSTGNGSLETWISSTNVGSWSESVAGTSTINQETTNPHSGTYCARFDVDASASNAQISQGVTSGKWYKYTFWARGSHEGMSVNTVSSSENSHSISTEWTQYTGYIYASTSSFGIKRGSGTTSKQIWIDDVTLQETNAVILDTNDGTGQFTLSKASGTVVANYDSITRSNVTGGASWYMANTTVDGGGNTGWSSDPTAPTNPTVSSVNVGGQAVTTGTWINYNGATNFNFTGASDADSGVLGYYTYFGTDSSADPSDYQAHSGAGGDTQTTSTSISSSDDGKHFYFRLKTKDAVGNISAAETLFDFGYDETLPTRPSFAASTPAGYTATNSFDFSWPAGTDPVGGAGASGIKYYEYKRATDVAWGHTLDSSQRSVVGLEAYQEGANAFFVRTVDLAGNISSNYQQVTYYFSGVAPAKPDNLTVTPETSDNNSFTFTWDKPAVGAGDPPIAGYYYSINAVPTMNNITYVPSTSDQVTLGPGAYATKQGLNTIYVLSKNDAGNYSLDAANYSTAEFTAQTASPPIPTQVSVTDSSDSNLSRWMLTLQWAAGAGQDPSTFDHYAIYRSSNSGVTYSLLSTTTSTAYIDSESLTNSTIYYYYIVAIDNAGKSSVASSVVGKTPTGKYQTPPSYLSTPAISDVKSNSSKIAWMTDRSSTSIVRYGKSTDDLDASSGQMDSTTSHEVNLNGLEPGTTYYYQVQSLDENRDYSASSAYSTSYSFSTLAAPAISNVQVSNITLTSADISWETTTVSTSKLYYGQNSSFDQEVEDISGASATKHSVKLSDLNHSSKYNFRLTATDVDGNELTSDHYNFETLPMPKMENLKATLVKDKARPGMKITWTSNVPTSSIVKYSINGRNEPPKEDTKAKLVTDHETIIENLSDQATYKIQVSGRDSLGNLAEESTTSLTTPDDSRPPVISDVVTETSNIGLNKQDKAQIIVSWSTDEPSSSRVEYGRGIAGENYEKQTIEDATLTNEHVVIISDLDPNSPYHIRVNSLDNAGNEAKSEDQTVISSEAQKSIINILMDSLKNIFGWVAKLM